MPYSIRKHGNKYWILDENGKKVGESSSRVKAEKSINARLAGEHGWEPTGKKKKK